MQIITIGEILWDVFDHAEFLGGAPLNFSAGVERLGNPVALITGLGDDARGRQAVDSMAKLGLSTEFVQVLPGILTGTARVSTDAQGNATFTIHRPAAFDLFRLDNNQLNALAVLDPGWIYFGTLAMTHGSTLAILERILHRIPPVKRFYDMNLREGHWSLPLVRQLSSLATILKLNETEAETLFALTRAAQPNAQFAAKSYSLEDFCRFWATEHAIETICVTLGSKGCAVFSKNELHLFDGYSVQVADTVGAGDAFAAAFLHGHIQGWPLARQAAFANALGALVASRPGATPAWTVDECLKMIA